MLNKERIVNATLEMAYLNPANTILVKTYETNGNKNVYASDYFIREADKIITPSVWKVKIVNVSGVVEGQWSISASQSFENHNIG